MSQEKVHLKVMVHHINLACGLWPNYYHRSLEKRLWTKDKSKVTCGKCKRSILYREDILCLKDFVKHMTGR